MGNPIVKLFGQTAIYGISSVLARLLNFLLVPLYTSLFATEVYAVVIEFYAYAVFLAIILTYGLETAYFRFSAKEDERKVFSTANSSLLLSSLVFLGLVLWFVDDLSSILGYANRPEYVLYFGLILAFDAMIALPMARLRKQGKAFKFAMLRFSNILLGLGLNLYWLVLVPRLENWDFLYFGDLGIEYIFIANVAASLLLWLLLLPEILRNLNWNHPLLKRMLSYSWPLLIAGLAGAINETLDRALLKYLLPKDVSMHMLGVYGACYKLAIFMTLFVQAFRMGAEPFFLDKSDNKEDKTTIAKVTHYFGIFTCFIFLLVSLFIDFFSGFIDESYHEGLHVVPILLGANLFLGLYVNLSVWFKLSNETRYGALLAIIGASLTLIINIVGIPKYGYEASAWATFAAYFSMFILSYIIGQNRYPIPYKAKRMLGYLCLTAMVFFLAKSISLSGYLQGTIGIFIFALSVFFVERRFPFKTTSQ